MPLEHHITVSHMARVLGLQESTIRRWVLEKRITYHKFGRAVRIPVSELERLIREGRREAIPVGAIAGR